VRRRPEEDDQEQEDGRQRDASGRRGPAYERRDGACRAADDDILRVERFNQRV
jgi:hypothetical protein